MADTKYYRAVAGVTHGLSYYSAGSVFVGDDDLNAAFEATGGKTSDGDVLYEAASKSDYDSYKADRDVLVDGSPRGIVGFEPVGDAAMAESQVASVDDDGKVTLVEADAEAGKPSDGDPLPPSSPEAERRAAVAGEDGSAGDQGGAEVPAEAPSGRGKRSAASE